jgi:hypothetical protein
MNLNKKNRTIKLFIKEIKIGEIILMKKIIILILIKI